MHYPKKRKPRGIKLNGEPSYDMCKYCYMPFCDSGAASLLYQQKIYNRTREGRCPACGNVVCTCKSTILTPKEWEEREKSRMETRKEFLKNQH